MDSKAKKIDQKEYLRRYLSGDKVKCKKKSKKRTKHLVVIDDDINHVAAGLPADEEELYLGEDAPQIVAEYIEERPVAPDKNNVNKWHCISDNKTSGKQEISEKGQSGKILHNSEREKRSNESSDYSPERRKNGDSTRIRTTERSFSQEDSDQSLPRKRTKHSKNTEHSKTKHNKTAATTASRVNQDDRDVDSLERKHSTAVRDSSRQRLQKPRSGSESSDQTPLRRQRSTVRLKGEEKDRKPSLVQIKQEDSDCSPPRRRAPSNTIQKRHNEGAALPFSHIKQEDSDQSPVRQRGRSLSRSPRVHIKRDDSDQSPQRAGYRSRSRIHGYERSSAVRIKQEDSDQSPQRSRNRSHSRREPKRDDCIAIRIKQEPSETSLMRSGNRSKSPRERRRDKRSPAHIKREESESKHRSDSKNYRTDNNSKSSRNAKSPRKNSSNHRRHRSRSYSTSDSEQSHRKSSRRQRNRNSRSVSFDDAGRSPQVAGDFRRSCSPERTSLRNKSVHSKYQRNAEEKDSSKVQSKKHSSSNSRPEHDRRSIRESRDSSHSDHSSPKRKERSHRKTSNRMEKGRTSSIDREHNTRVRRKSPRRSISNESIDSKYEKRQHHSKDGRKVSSPKLEEGNQRKVVVDSKKAGLQSAKDLKEEMTARRDGENRMIAELSSEVSGRDAEVQVRRNNRFRRKREEEDPEKRKLREERELATKEQYERWGKGLKQIEDHRAMRANEAYEGSKPLARYANDEDLERFLREQERADDPMLQYMRQRRKEKEAEAEKDSGVPFKPKRPTYEGPYPENRFGIPPGYRWDGVDRSNGFEQRWFQTQNETKARQEEAYKYSVEDM